MSLVARLLALAAAAIGILVVFYAISFAGFLIGYFYAVPKYEEISPGDTRAIIEERKGLLSSRREDRSVLGGYQFVPPFAGLLSDPQNEIVSYSLFFASFTVIYDKEGNYLAKIDNGLDG